MNTEVPDPDATGLADSPDKPQRPRWLIYTLIALPVIVVGVLIGVLSGGADPGVEGVDSTTTSSTSSTSTLPPTDLEVIIDGGLTPAVPQLPPLPGDDTPRTVGRMATEDGTTSDFVLGDIALFLPDPDQLALLEDRDDIEILIVDDSAFQTFGEGHPSAGLEVLVRLTQPFDTTLVAHHLSELEPDLTGTLRVSDEEALQTVAALGSFSFVDGIDASLDHLYEGDDIPSGTLTEGNSDNAFDWTFVASTANQEIGLDTAWQMIFFEGLQNNRVGALVVDRGFDPNNDFPAESSIWEAEWGPADDWTCGGNPCPYHGTNVSNTITGVTNNVFGTAGVVGPFSRLVALPTSAAFNTNMAIRAIVQEEDIDVINMSYGGTVTTGVNAAVDTWRRTIEIAEEYGALAFASAGNDGADVDSLSGRRLPCTADGVVCVGGMGIDETTRHANSAYGTVASDNSVAIFGPFCVVSVNNPGSDNVGQPRRGCGTSHSSPFVAGVAALLRVADPTITVAQMRNILFSTAHVGDLGEDVTGHQRRVNAHEAVATVLGFNWTAPTITVTHSGTYQFGDVASMQANARSATNEALGVTWRSDRDGHLAGPTLSPVGTTNLSPGEHMITVSATDRRGLTVSQDFFITIGGYDEPEAAIVTPSNDAVFYEGTTFEIIGWANDPNPFAGTVDLDILWQIRRRHTGDVVGGSTSFPSWTPQVPPPGEYTIHLLVSDPHSTVERTIDIEIRELEPGWSFPYAEIVTPDEDLDVGLLPNDSEAQIPLVGRAFGTDGNQIPGTRLRWTAVNNHGQTIPICTGNNYPGGPGGLAPINDCSSTTATLPATGDPSVMWAIRLEAVGNNGVEANPASRSVHVMRIVH